MFIRTDTMGGKLLNFHRINSNIVQENVKKISSGLRINSASDDAAGLMIADRLKSQIIQKNKEIENYGQTKSFLQTSDGVLQTVSDHLQRMKELSVQYQNGTYSNLDKVTIKNEFQELWDSIQNITSKATYNNVPLFTTGKTLVSDGTNGPNISVPYIPNPTDALTIQVRIKVTLESPQKYHYIFDSRDSNTSGGVWLAINGTGRLAYGDGVKTIGSPVVLKDGEWYDVAIVSTDTQTKFYMDGNLVATRNESFNKELGNNLKLGSRFPNTESWKGEIDEIKLWDKELSEQEIEEGADKVLTGNEDGLIADWNFNEVSGNIAYDKSSNGYDGTITGMSRIHQDTVLKINDLEIERPELLSSSYSELNIEEPDFLQKLDTYMNEVISARTDIGTKMNVIDFKTNNLNSSLQNHNQSKSRIVDADMSQVSSDLLKNEIKLQSNVTMLQKNQQNRQNVLNLLQT